MITPSFIHIREAGDRTITFDHEGRYVVYLDGVSGEYSFDIVASGVDLQIFGAYRGSGDTRYTLHTLQRHQAPNAVSNLLIKSVLTETSHFDYHGLIRIEADCNGSHAYQRNQNLILSPYATVESKPDLEILSHEVFCTHGSSTGRPDRDKLYYLQSRGITMDEARELYINGFLDEVYVKVDTARSAFREV